MKRKAIFFNKAFSAFSRWLFDPHSTDDQRIESVNKRVKEIKQSN